MNRTTVKAHRRTSGGRLFLEALVAAAIITVAVPLAVAPDMATAPSSSVAFLNVAHAASTGDINDEVNAARVAVGAPELEAHPVLDRMASNAAINSANAGTFVPANLDGMLAGTGAFDSEAVELDVVNTEDPVELLNTLEADWGAVMNDDRWTHFGSGYAARDGKTTLKIVYAAYPGTDGSPSAPAVISQPDLTLDAEPGTTATDITSGSTPSTSADTHQSAPSGSEPDAEQLGQDDDQDGPVLDTVERTAGYALGGALGLTSLWSWSRTWKARPRKNTPPGTGESSR